MAGFPIDHDLHVHTRLSVCSQNPEMTPANLLAFARANGYTALCLTDHLWDEGVPDPNGFYAVQGIEHVKQSLPLPDGGGVQLFFGCETEYCGADRLALRPENYDQFDFIVIPLNHFHMKGLTCDGALYDSDAALAALLMQRMQELTLLPLPWKKVGLAHLNCELVSPKGDMYKVLSLLPEDGLKQVFAFHAKHGTGIELNASSFDPGWEEHEEAALRVFRIAKEAGCKFYLCSDAHSPKALNKVSENLPRVVEKLGLTRDDLFSLG